MKKLLKLGTFLFCLIACVYWSQESSVFAATADTKTAKIKITVK